MTPTRHMAEPREIVPDGMDGGRAVAALLTTEDRRRIWTALRRGSEIYITPESRVVDRITGEDFGCQIAAQAILFAGYARFRPGTEWVIEWDGRQSPGGAR